MTHMEVGTRSIQTRMGLASTSVTFTPGSADTSLMLHAQRQILDSASGALRKYFFSAGSAPPVGLLTSEEDWDNLLTKKYRTSAYRWATDAWGHPYVAESDVTLDPDSSASATTKTTQAMAGNNNGP